MYNLHHLEELRHIPNVGSIVEHIDLAATKAATIMRAIGQKLSPEDSRPPMLDELDTHLRRLVSEAYDGLMTSLEEAPPGAVELQCEGYGSDDNLFDVVLHSVHGEPGHLDVTISMRL